MFAIFLSEHCIFLSFPGPPQGWLSLEIRIADLEPSDFAPANRRWGFSAKRIQNAGGRAPHTVFTKTAGMIQAWQATETFKK